MSLLMTETFFALLQARRSNAIGENVAEDINKLSQTLVSRKKCFVSLMFTPVTMARAALDVVSLRLVMTALISRCLRYFNIRL